MRVTHALHGRWACFLPFMAWLATASALLLTSCATPKTQSCYETELLEAEELLREAEDRLEPLNQLTTELGIGAVFSCEPLLDLAKRAREAAGTVRTTSEDLEGIRALGAARWADAIEHFDASGEKFPGRGFPHLFAGIAEFDRGRYAAALLRFEAARADEDCRRLAILLAELMQLADANPPARPADLLPLFVRAFHAAGEQLSAPEPRPSFATTMVPDFADVPAVFKAEALHINEVAPERTERLTLMWANQVPPSLLSAASTLLNGEITAEQLEDFAEVYPESPAFEIVAVLRRFLSEMDEEELLENWAAFDEELNRVRALDPENGALELLSIRWPRSPVDYEETEDGEEFETGPRALDASELEILHRAVTAPRFEYYYRFLQPEALRASELIHGAFGRELRPVVSPLQAHLRIVARATENVTQLLRSGDLASAARVRSDLRRLMLRGGECYPPPFPSFLRKLTVKELAMPLHTAGSEDLWREEIQGLDEIFRDVFSRNLHELLEAIAIPSLTLLHMVTAISQGSAPAAVRRAYDVKLELEREELLEQAIAKLESNLKDTSRFYGHDQIVLLGDLADPSALPLLEELQTYDNHPLVPALARWTISQIRP